VRKKLEAGKESAYMSKKLAALWLDAPVPLDLERMDGQMGANPAKIAALLEKLEFRSLARHRYSASIYELRRLTFNHRICRTWNTDEYAKISPSCTQR
jgi:5'-3' exonuclease